MKLDQYIKHVIGKYATDPLVYAGDISAIEALAMNIRKSSGYTTGDDLHDFVQNTLGGRIQILDSVSWREIDACGSMVVHGFKDFDIFLPSSTSSVIDNFTIAHELGHYFLHSRDGRFPILMPRLGNSRCDQEANCFAANFLMPKAEFIEKYEEDPKTISLAAHFSIPTKLIERRKQSLGLDTDPRLKQAINKIYNQLLKEQEPLGKEFTKILFDNLHDLYEVDD